MIHNSDVILKGLAVELSVLDAQYQDLAQRIFIAEGALFEELQRADLEKSRGKDLEQLTLNLMVASPSGGAAAEFCLNAGRLLKFAETKTNPQEIQHVR